MIARAKLEVILGALAPRLSGAVAQAIQIDPAPEPGASITTEGIAVVPVIGTLVTRSGYLSAASGLSSYGAIGDAVTSAFEDPAVRGIILEIDLPGGEVVGALDTDTLRRLYETVPFTNDDLANAETKAAALPEPRAHALLCQAAEHQTTPLGKAGLIARALNSVELRALGTLPFRPTLTPP